MRQSTYSRRVGYEDVNDAERLSVNWDDRNYNHTSFAPNNSGANEADMTNLAIICMCILLLTPVALAEGAPWQQVREQARPNAVTRRTMLVRDGKPVAMIATPDDPAYDAVAAELQAVIAEASGYRIPVVKASTLVSGAVFTFTDQIRSGEMNLIVLGDLSSNRVATRLYMDYLAFEDRAYPGGGGYTVRTLVDPQGVGWNAVLLGGPGPAEVRAAVQHYRKQIQTEAKTCFSDYCLDVTFGDGPFLDRIKASIDSMRKALAPFDANTADPSSKAYQQRHPNQPSIKYALTLLNRNLVYGGLHYGLTGEPAFAEMAGRALDVLYEHLDWVETHRTQPYDDHYTIEIWLRAWQQVAGCPFITDQQRARGYAVMAFFAGQTSLYRHDPSTYGKTRYRILSRHEYSGVFAGNALCRWVQLHGKPGDALAPVLTANRDSFRVIIDAMTQTYTTGFDHKWGLDGNWNLLQVAVEDPRPQYVQSDMARMNADYAVMCIDNTGRWVNFGADNISPMEGYDAWQILGRAETLIGDGTYQWWLDNRMKRMPYKCFIMGYNWHGHWYHTAHTPVEPTYLIGINRALLPRPIYDDLRAGRGRLYKGLPVVNDVPFEQTFHKITFRDGLGQDDQYLLLDGLGGTPYSGNDANEIAEYSRYGQQLIVAIEGKEDPFYRNMVSVSRGNEPAHTGMFARLHHMADIGPLAYTCSQVDPLAGAGNVRHLFMEKGGYIVVLDDVTMRESAEYFLTCNFRSLGQPTLDEAKRTWRTNNDTVDLIVQNVAVPGMDPAPLFAQGVRTNGTTAKEWHSRVNVLRETVARHFDAGQTYRFANLFYGAHAAATAPWRATAMGSQAVAVHGKQGAIVYAAAPDGRVQLGDLHIRGQAVRVARDSVQFIAATDITIGDTQVLSSAAPVTVSFDLVGESIDCQDAAVRQVRTIVFAPVWEEHRTFAEIRRTPTVHGDVTFGDPSVLRAAVDSLLAQASRPASSQIATSSQSVAQPVNVRTLLATKAQVVDAAPADMDGDGRDEMVLATQAGRVIAVDQDGNVIFDDHDAAQPLFSLWAGSINGKPMVITGAENGVVRARDATGAVRWSYTNHHSNYGTQPTVYSLTVGDFDGDGTQRIALGGHGCVVLLNDDGSFVRATMVNHHGTRPLRPVQIGDGAKQWLQLYTWGSGMKLVDPITGFVAPGWDHQWGGLGTYLSMRHLRGDDAIYGVYAGPNGVGVGKLNLDALSAGSRIQQELWSDAWTIHSDGQTTAALVDDFDGNGESEILTGVETGFLVCYKPDGTRSWKQLIGTPINAIVWMDFDDNGEKQFIVAGESPALTRVGVDHQPHALAQPHEPIDRLWVSGKVLLAVTRSGAVLRISSSH